MPTSSTEPPPAFVLTEDQLTSLAAKIVAKEEQRRDAAAKVSAAELLQRRSLREAAAKFETATVRDGQFIRYGVTGGVAAVLHIDELPFKNHGQQDAAAVSVMPYIAVLPRPWFVQGEITEAYCASKWLVGDAKKAADNLAKARTAEAGGDPNNRDSVLNETDWDIAEGMVARCGGPLYGIGLYAGLPSKFSANGRASESDASVVSREFQPLVSFGILWAPVIYVSALAGITVSNVKNDQSKLDRVWSWTMGVGGNLDILPTILSGK